MKSSKRLTFISYVVALEILHLMTFHVVAAPNGLVIEEIVVSARKREENLQQVPVSMMSFSSFDLEKQNVSDFIDLSTKLPNVNLSGSGGMGSNNASFWIRGLGSGGRNSLNTENSVGLYIDDAYYGKTDGAVLNVIDVERIEVLRGPQGTLFGRNSTAGAIRYITAKPSVTDTEGNISLTLGSFSRHDFKASGNIPLGDKAAMRLTATSLNRDGHVDNAITGEELGSKETIAFRGAFLSHLTDALDFNVSLDYSKTDSTGAPSKAIAITPVGGIWGAPFAATEDAENLAQYGLDQASVPTNDFFTTYGAGANYTDSEQIGVNFVVDYDFNESLHFKSATSYRNIETDVGVDIDGTPAELVERVTQRDIDSLSQEFQLSGSNSRVDWVAGLFYLNEDATAFQDDFRMVNADTMNVGISGAQLVDPHKTESYAIYGQATFSLNESLDITTGARYTEDKKSMKVFTAGPGGTRNDVVLVSDASDKWNAVSGLVSLEWQVTNDIFAYASYSRGFRSGGLNDEGNATPFLPFEEEIVQNYELGIRTDLLNKRLRVNLTAFFTDADDLQFTAQLNPTSSESVIRNAGGAEIKGLEAEIVVLLNELISVDFDLGYLDSKYVDIDPLNEDVAEGDRLTQAPKLSFNLGVNVVIPLKNNSELDTRIDYGWKDDFTLFTGNPLAQESYGLLNFNVTYQQYDSNWNVSVFGTNLLDEEYAISGLDIGGQGGALGFTQVEPGRPRELGITVKYDF